MCQTPRIQYAITTYLHIIKHQENTEKTYLQTIKHQKNIEKTYLWTIKPQGNTGKHICG